MATPGCRLRRLAAHVAPPPPPLGPAPAAAGPAEVLVLAARRTPIGAAGGALAGVPAVALGAAAIRASVEAAGVPAEAVEECVMGNVLGAGLGQAPAKQAALAAGLSNATRCTTVNKVCASGLKAVTMVAQSIALGYADLAVAGGMESMSNVPYYLTGEARLGRGLRHGDQRLDDGVSLDGLSDPWRHETMGVCGDLCAREHGVSREAQDAYAARSYRLAAEAHSRGVFAQEIVPVTRPSKARGGRAGRPPATAARGGDDAAALRVEADEEVTRGGVAAFASLRPAFGPDGTVTAASSSKISDGAAAVVLASRARAEALGARPVARVVAFADAEREPERFTTAPSLAIRAALARAGLRAEDIDVWEINEAFAVVVLANAKLLGLDLERVNVLGGACALGHPLGCSGARIVATVCTAMVERRARYGVAAICNGGGGATALVLERCE